MENPKCPKCPYGKDDNIAASRVKLGQWFCHGCKTYFPKIADVSPPVSVKNTVLLEVDENLRWSAEEVTGAKDRALAQFYAGLNSEDRGDMLRAQININGDFRGEPNELKNDAPPSDITTFRDTV